MDTLTAIFGSISKVKILRLFLFNGDVSFFLKEVVDKTKSPIAVVRKELSMLEKASILKSKRVSKEIEVVVRNKKQIKKLEGQGYTLNTKYPYLDPLKNLLTITSLKVDESLVKRFASAGKVKIFIVAGIFTQNWDSRVDLLIVGDDLNLNKIENVIKVIESEMGKEIAYSAFETQDFEYRFGIHDRLIRDVLDYPHVTLMDRIGIEPQ